MLYYRSLKTVSTLLRRGNISGRPYYWTITIALNQKHVLYIYITPMKNYHNGIIAYFIKLEFITKLT